jgi:hypothetical protein
MTCSLYYLAEAYHPKWQFDWNTIRSEMIDSIRFVERHGIGSTCEGFSCRVSRSLSTRKWLQKKLTDEELMHLKNYPNGRVKAMAYEGLLKRSNINHFSLLREVIVDNDYGVDIPAGCRRAYLLLSDYLFEHHFPELCFRPLFVPNNEINIRLEPFEKRKLREEYYWVHLNRDWYFRQMRLRQ